MVKREAVRLCCNTHHALRAGGGVLPCFGWFWSCTCIWLLAALRHCINTANRRWLNSHDDNVHRVNVLACRRNLWSMGGCCSVGAVLLRLPTWRARPLDTEAFTQVPQHTVLNELLHSVF